VKRGLVFSEDFPSAPDSPSSSFLSFAFFLAGVAHCLPHFVFCLPIYLHQDWLIHYRAFFGCCLAFFFFFGFPPPFLFQAPKLSFPSSANRPADRFPPRTNSLIRAYLASFPHYFLPCSGYASCSRLEHLSFRLSLVTGSFFKSTLSTGRYTARYSPDDSTPLFPPSVFFFPLQAPSPTGFPPLAGYGFLRRLPPARKKVTFRSVSPWRLFFLALNFFLDDFGFKTYLTDNSPKKTAKIVFEAVILSCPPPFFFRFLSFWPL